MNPKKVIYLSTILFFILSLQTQSFAQEKTETSKLYENDFIKFNYPSQWSLLDKSNEKDVHLRLSLKNKDILILITSPKLKIKNQDKFLVSTGYNILNQYSDITEKALSTNNSKAEKTVVCSSFKEKKVGNTQFKGIHNNQSAKGNIYSLMLDNRIINLVYLRTDKDSPAGEIAWNTIINSIKINNKQNPSEIFSFITEEQDLGNTAIKLVKPSYPSEGFGSATISIKVVINEQGKVIRAKSLGKRNPYVTEAIVAAKQSKFKPSISCNGNVKTVGLIVYKFGSR